jgi:signal transduction histidine kinase
VVREYAQMHGGSAEIVGETPGAHIRIRLPLSPQAAIAQPNEPRPVAEAEAVR